MALNLDGFPVVALVLQEVVNEEVEHFVAIAEHEKSRNNVHHLVWSAPDQLLAQYLLSCRWL